MYIKLLNQNWEQVLRSYYRLSYSVCRLNAYFPLSESSLSENNEELYERLDAFRVRYGDLQDCLGAKVFRNLLLAEDEEPLNMADTLNRMEKRGILASADHWRTLRNVRNSFTHDYPTSNKERADALNVAFSSTNELMSVAENIFQYCQKQSIHLEVLNVADNE